MKKIIKNTVAFLAAAAVVAAVFAQRDKIKSFLNDYLVLPIFYIEPSSSDSSEHDGKYYYENLSDVEKQAYSLIYENIFDFPAEIWTPKLSEAEFNNVNRAVVYDNPELFFLKPSCSMVFKSNHCLYCPEYQCGVDEYEKMRKEIEAVRAEVYSKIPPTADDYTKEKVIHDSIIALCAYEEGEWDSGIYGSLKNGRAVCSGYARAVQYLLGGLGIKNYVVTGKAGEKNDKDKENHMWNVVYISDKPYYLDATWDDGDYKNGEAGYAFFNVTDSAVSATHTPENPADSGCVWIDDNYFVREGLYFTYIGDDFDSHFEEKLRARILEGDTNFSIAFSDGELMKEAADYLITEQRIYDVLSNIRHDTGLRLDDDYINYSLDEIMKIIRFDLASNLGR